MKLFVVKILTFFLAAGLLSSCATIVGGNTYYAHVEVIGKPKAEIIHNGVTVGVGKAVIKVKRSDANRFSVRVRQKECDERIFSYRSRSFRGWAFLGSLLTFTGLINGVPIPYGLVVDVASGALWKPNVAEKGIVKLNYRHYRYIINYTTCEEEEEEKEEEIPLYVEVVYLKNGSVIRGIILEQIPNVQLKIETADGNIFIFKMEEVEKIAKEIQTRKKKKSWN